MNETIEATKTAADTVKSISNADTVKSISKWPLTFVIVLVILVVTLPFVLGELHGEIPDALRSGIIISKDGYKVTYGFDFLPSVFKFATENEDLSFYSAIGVLVLLVTPIIGVILNAYVKIREIKRDTLPIINEQKKLLEEIQNSHEITMFDKRHEYNMQMKEKELQIDQQKHENENNTMDRKHQLYLEKKDRDFQYQQQKRQEESNLVERKHQIQIEQKNKQMELEQQKLQTEQVRHQRETAQLQENERIRQHEREMKN